MNVQRKKKRSKTKTPVDIKSSETMQEFLARGGKVNVVASVEPKVVAKVLQKSSGGPAILLTMEEGNLYYGEGKPPKKTKAKPSININDLPEPLRNKYLKELRDEYGVQEDDEEDYTTC